MRSFNIAVLICLALLFTDFAVCDGDNATQVPDSSDGDNAAQVADSSDGDSADQLGDSSDGDTVGQVADSSVDNGSNSIAQVDTGSTDNTKENPAVVTSNSTDATRNDTDGTTERDNVNQPAEGDDLNDDATVLKPDAISDASDNGVHTVKLMLYIIAPISALVVIYFIMKGLRGNSRMFLNRYHVVAGTDDKDNIELRPLELSDEEDDVVFESSRLT